jgi:hypothetical protein
MYLVYGTLLDGPSTDFPSSLNSEEVPSNIDYLKTLEIEPTRIEHAQPLVEFLAEKGAHLTLLKIKSFFSFTGLVRIFCCPVSNFAFSGRL